MARLGKKRLTVDLQTETYDALKGIAGKHNVTISDLIKELVESLINYENQFE